MSGDVVHLAVMLQAPREVGQGFVVFSAKLVPAIDWYSGNCFQFEGMAFDSNGVTAEAIREEESYSGIRATLDETLSRALTRFHVDVNAGDPIWPEPQQISLRHLIEGAISVRGDSLEMVHTEKIVTARWGAARQIRAGPPLLICTC